MAFETPSLNQVQAYKPKQTVGTTKIATQEKKISINVEYPTYENKDYVYTPSINEKTSAIEMKEISSVLSEIIEKTTFESNQERESDILLGEEAPTTETSAEEVNNFENEAMQTATDIIATAEATALEQIKIYAESIANYAKENLGGTAASLGFYTDWCLSFVNMVLANNGAFSDVKGFNLNEASCSAEVAYIKSNNPEAFHMAYTEYEPQVGDVFFITNTGSDRGTYPVKHTGLVSGVNRDSSGNIISINTIEGNTQATGGYGSYYTRSKVGTETYSLSTNGNGESQYVVDGGNNAIYGFFNTTNNIVSN